MRFTILAILLAVAACSKDPKACRDACDKQHEQALAACGSSDDPKITDSAKVARLDCAIATYEAQSECTKRCDAK